MEALNERVQTWERLWGRLLQSVLWLGLSCVVAHGSPHTVSAPFRVDTRTASETASAAFAVDTRPLNGIWTSAESGNTRLDTSPATLRLSLALVVRDTNGQPISDAYIIIQRYDTTFWQGHTGADGSVPLTALPAGNYNVVVIKQGYTSLFQSVPGHAGGPLSLALAMPPAPKLPDLVEVDRTPAETTIRPPEPSPPPGERHANFRVFDGSVFSHPHPTAPRLPNDRMTIVIVHGYLSDLEYRPERSDNWGVGMARLIAEKHQLDNMPNIVGWDWKNQAKGFPLPVAEAAIQGNILGKSLYDELGPGYNQRIHFIGHSLGTIVNAVACDYLHGANSRSSMRPLIPWTAALTRPHVTLLDQAELANAVGSAVTTSSNAAWLDAQSRSGLLDLIGGVLAGDYKSPFPFPVTAAWMDNYMTLVGLYHSNAVNVYLSTPETSPLAIFRNHHSYSREWYRDSLEWVSTGHVLGFNRSYERSEFFPPVDLGMSPGSAWASISATPDQFDFTLLEGGTLAAYRGIDLTIKAGTVIADRIVGVLEPVGRGVLDAYEMGMNVVGEVGGAVIQKTGQVTASVSEKIGNVWDAALDKASSINPNRLFIGSLVAPSLKLLFRTTSILPSPSGFPCRRRPRPGCRFRCPRMRVSSSSISP